MILVEGTSDRLALEALALRRGRDLDADGAAALARARQVVQMYVDVVASLDPTLELKPGEDPPLEKFAFAGTPGDVARKARALLDAGAHRVEFGSPHGRLDLLCDRVLPELRR